ncbi:hypothetical protein [Natrinema sp. SYSU A 869]|nr:hypothetical protein [Natrinema sp. SYSU A 869]
MTTDGTESATETERDGPTDPDALLERKRDAQSALDHYPLGDGDRPAVVG